MSVYLCFDSPPFRTELDQANVHSCISYTDLFLEDIIQCFSYVSLLQFVSFLVCEVFVLLIHLVFVVLCKKKIKKLTRRTPMLHNKTQFKQNINITTQPVETLISDHVLVLVGL